MRGLQHFKSNHRWSQYAHLRQAIPRIHEHGAERLLFFGTGGTAPRLIFADGPSLNVSLPFVFSAQSAHQRAYHCAPGLWQLLLCRVLIDRSESTADAGGPVAYYAGTAAGVYPECIVTYSV